MPSRGVRLHEVQERGPERRLLVDADVSHRRRVGREARERGLQGGNRRGVVRAVLLRRVVHRLHEERERHRLVDARLRHHHAALVERLAVIARREGARDRLSRAVDVIERDLHLRPSDLLLVTPA